MLQFHYRAVGVDGHPVDGEVTASSILAAAQSLEKQGLRVLDLHPLPVGASRQPIHAVPAHQAPISPAPAIPSVTPQRKAPRLRPWTWSLLPTPSAIEQGFYFRRLRAILLSGMPLVVGLSSLEDESQSLGLKIATRQMRDSVGNGGSIGQVMEMFPGVFSPTVTQTIKGGEMGGYLPQAVQQIIDHLDTDARLSGYYGPGVLGSRFALRGMGVIIIMAAFGIGISLMRYYAFRDVGPAYNYHPQSYGPNWRFGTAATYHPSYLSFGRVRSWFIVLGAFILFYFAQRSPSTRKSIEPVLQKIPFVSPIIHRFAEARFAEALGLMLNSGIEVAPAVEQSIGVAANCALESALIPELPALRNGAPLSATMVKTGFFSKDLTDFIYTGEMSGTLPQSTAYIAEHINRDARTRVARFIAICGLIWATIAVALVYVAVRGFAPPW